MSSISSANMFMKLAAIASLGSNGPLSSDDYFSGNSAQRSANAVSSQMSGLRNIIQQSIKNSFSLLA